MGEKRVDDCVEKTALSIIAALYFRSAMASRLRTPLSSISPH